MLDSQCGVFSLLSCRHLHLLSLVWRMPERGAASYKCHKMSWKQNLHEICVLQDLLYMLQRSVCDTKCNFVVLMSLGNVALRERKR